MLVPFSASGAETSKEAPTASQRGATSGPRAAKTTPRAALQSSPPAHLAPNCRPRAPRRPPEGHLGALGALFSTLRGPILRTKHLTYFMKHLTHVRITRLNLQPSGKQFRLLLGLSKARAQKPKKPEKANTEIPPIRPSKQSLAPKRLANKGGRRCWQSHNNYCFE